MRQKSISTKIMDYKIHNEVPSLYTKDKNEDEFSCPDRCLDCLRCELGRSTMELIYGGL